jgi:hypothetical protein
MGTGASVEEPREDPAIKKLDELEAKLDEINAKLNKPIENNIFIAKRTDTIPSDSGILGRILGYDPEVKTKKRAMLEEIRNHPWRND